MNNITYGILFYLEIVLALAALIYAVARLARDPNTTKFLGTSVPKRAKDSQPAGSAGKDLAFFTALGVVMAAVSGAVPNPYLHSLGSVAPSASIRHVAAVKGDPCAREVFMTANIPHGDVVAIGVAVDGRFGADFQSDVTSRGPHEWVSIVGVGGASEAGHVILLTPIVLPATTEADILDVSRISLVQDRTSTYWMATRPPSSAVYIGRPGRVVRSLTTTGCPS